MNYVIFSVHIIRFVATVNCSMLDRHGVACPCEQTAFVMCGGIFPSILRVLELVNACFYMISHDTISALRSVTNSKSVGGGTISFADVRS